MIHEIITEMRQRAYRISIYKDSFSDWAEFLERTASDLETDAEDAHDECHSQEYIDQNFVHRDDFEELQEKLTRKGQTKARQKLLEKIERLETELSNAKADIEVYKRRIDQGAVPAKLAEMFIFSPEEARAHFRCIEGGAA